MSGLNLIIGGTGKTGGALVERLVASGHTVRSASRSGASVPGSKGLRFDWNDPATFAAAVDGVDGLYLVAPVGVTDQLPLVEPFVERALSAGVRRFVLLSSSLIDEGGPAMGQIHALLRQRAPEWVALRPSWFMENFIHEPHLSTLREERAIYSATVDGRVPFISVADIADVAFEALTGEAATTELLMTGPEALTYDEVAEAIGQKLGEPVRHIRLSSHELADRHARSGIPAEFAGLLAGLDGAIAMGAEARTTSTVQAVTGRPPVSFSDFVARHVKVWEPDRRR